MSVERTLDVVKMEYTQLLVKAGQLYYQIQVYQEDLNSLNSQIKELNFEAARLQEQEATKKAEADKKAADEASAKALADRVANV